MTASSRPSRKKVYSTKRYSYPDPNDVDDNPLLVDLFRPSVLCEDDLFVFVAQYLRALGVSQTLLATAIGTTAGTLSGMFSHKYAFGALGIVKKMREWVSYKLIEQQNACFRKIIEMYNQPHKDSSLLPLHLSTSPLYRTSVTAKFTIQQKVKEDEKAGKSFTKQGDPTELAGKPESQKELTEGKQEESNTDVHDDIPSLPLVEVDLTHHALQSDALPTILARMRIDVTADKFLKFLMGTTSLEDLIEIQKRIYVQTTAAVNSGSARKKRESIRGTLPDVNETQGRPKRVRKSILPANAVLETSSADEEEGEKSSKTKKIKSRKKKTESNDVDYNPEEDSAVIKQEESESSDNEDSTFSRTENTFSKSDRVLPPPFVCYPTTLTLDRRVPLILFPFVPSPFNDPSWDITKASTTLQLGWDRKMFVFSNYDTIDMTIDEKLVHLDCFTAQTLTGNACVLFTGGPVRCLVFAPVGNDQHSATSVAHYLATSSDLTQVWRGKALEAGFGAVQIWELGTGSDCANETPHLALLIRHQHGTVRCMKWLHFRDAWQPNSAETLTCWSRLGFLCLTFSDGTQCITAIPHPQPLYQSKSIVCSSTTIISIDLECLPTVHLLAPLLYQQPTTRDVVTVDLAVSPLSSRVALARSEGALFVYDLQGVIAGPEPLSPMYDVVTRVGDIGLRSVVFSPCSAHQVCVGTQDGYLQIWDTRSTSNLPLVHLMLGFDPIQSICWPRSRLDVLLVAYKDNVRIIPLLKIPSSERTFPWLAFPSFPLTLGSQYLSLAALDDEQVEALLVAGTTVDGQVLLSGSSVHLIGRERSTRHVLMSRLLYCHMGPSAAETVNTSLHMRLSIEAESIAAQPKDWKTAKMRRLDDGWLCTKAEELVFNSRTAMTCVVFNPSLTFPRIVASGSLSGLVILQCVNTM